MIAALFLSQVTVTLAPQASARGNEITLGEVARVEGATPSELDVLRALDLGYVPSPGYARTFQRWQIEAALNAKLAGAALVMAGADTCRVEPALDALGADELRSSARRALEAHFAGRELSIEPSGILANLLVPVAERARELRPLVERIEAGTESVLVPVQVWIDGSLHRTVQTSFKVGLFERLPVLVRDVRRGEALDQGAVEVRRTRLDLSLGTPIQASALAGATATRDLGHGAVLLERDVQRARLVKTGDVVQLEIRKGAVSARVSAIAAQEGFLGDRVRVTTADKKKELSAVVVGRGLVELELGK